MVQGIPRRKFAQYLVVPNEARKRQLSSQVPSTAWMADAALLELSNVTYAEADIGESLRCEEVCTFLLFTIIFTIFPYCPKYE